MHVPRSEGWWYRCERGVAAMTHKRCAKNKEPCCSPPIQHTIALVALIAQVGCSAIAEAGRYTERSMRWISGRPSAYDLRDATFLLFLADVAVVVVVRGNTVEAAAFADDSTTVHPTFNDASTIDGVFDIIADAIGRNSARVDVTYDPVLGYPPRSHSTDLPPSPMTKVGTHSPTSTLDRLAAYGISRRTASIAASIV